MLQDYVEVRLDSPEFACDQIRIYKLSGREAISQLFSFEIEIAVIDNTELELEKVMGADATLIFSSEPSGTEIRQVHGMIVTVDAMLETAAPQRTYRLKIAP